MSTRVKDVKVRNGALPTVLAFMLALAMVIIHMGKAHAATDVTHEPVPDVTVTQLADGVSEVKVDGETFSVETDEASHTATLTYPDGSQVTVDALAGSEGGFALKSSMTCTVIMWAVSLVHSTGWAGAIAVVAASGPVGATVLLTMYALGSNLFLAWAAGQC